jgi:hypothetical protein
MAGMNIGFMAIDTVGIGAGAGYIYVMQTTGLNSFLYQVNISTSEVTQIYVDSGGIFYYPTGLAFQYQSPNAYLYVTNAYGNVAVGSLGYISRIDVTTKGNVTILNINQTWLKNSSLASPRSLSLSPNNTTLFVVADATVCSVDTTTASITTTHTITSTYISIIDVFATAQKLYVTEQGLTPGVITISPTLSTGESPFYTGPPFSVGPQAFLPSGITSDGTSLFVSRLPGDIYRFPLNETVACFKEGSLILTDRGYVQIELLRPGDLVKTFLHEFKPIEMIGKRDMYHCASKERIKDQLYICRKDDYPELLEDLVVTGCHSILVDEFLDDEERARAIDVNGKIYLTDDMYRLPACADLRAGVFSEPGFHTIYHLALENNDYYMNYGIYANGLLVETCSKRYIKELSGMELL